MFGDTGSLPLSTAQMRPVHARLARKCTLAARGFYSRMKKFQHVVMIKETSIRAQHATTILLTLTPD
jgi:hypothetical protein